mmetsp:Transcript_28087/g.41377  ORF Transcript_28087/g.41377 Transcript_28087/m.41377 type:complete len:883 (-) Transcript_28087:409-3057(-)
MKYSPSKLVDVEVGSGDTCELKANGMEDTPEHERIASASPVAWGFYPQLCFSSSLSFRIALFCGLIFLLGVGTSVSFITIGVENARATQRSLFERRSFEVVNSIENAWQSYETMGLYIHEAARKLDITRQDFRELYEYLNSSDVSLQVVAFNPNISAEERPALEAESKAYYDENYPQIGERYRGVTALLPDPNALGGVSVQPSPNRSFYFPSNFVEPISLRFSQAVELDMYQVFPVTRSIDLALSHRKPALSRRLKLSAEINRDIYSVLLVHPGIPLSTDKPTDDGRGSFATVAVRMPDLLRDVTLKQVEQITVFIFDATVNESHPTFLGGSTVLEAGESFQIENSTTLEDVRRIPRLEYEVTLDIALAKWTVAVVAVEGTYEAESTYIIIGGVVILVSCFMLMGLMWSQMHKHASLAKLEASVQREKAKEARKSAQSERELNEFIAHEVRNPLSAAMSACSFVSTTLTDDMKPLVGANDHNVQQKCVAVASSQPQIVSYEQETIQSAVDDCQIVMSSLHFMNDLMRNMLDLQRVLSNRLELDMKPTAVLQDILMPVDSMLYRRGAMYEVETSCEEDLFVLTDRLRLKQIVLNLARNSSKFVQKGFIRLRGEVVDGNVVIFVEDSGPGIPDDKKSQIFTRFQESLDTLSQGTGIGLSLCKRLTELLGAEICLDTTFDSGVSGCPGTRFAVKLNRPPVQLNEEDFGIVDTSVDKIPSPPLEHPPEEQVDNSNDTSPQEATALQTDEEEQLSPVRELPENLNVLFVDDDMILRKLFCRSVRKCAPTWTVKEAASGESALKLAGENSFDIIFMDQYMTSVEKQLLGTETTAALRAQGYENVICGLSANDKAEEFSNAGANAFIMKPLPCKQDELKFELFRVMGDV